jgi:hypothetical protein
MLNKPETEEWSTDLGDIITNTSIWLQMADGYSGGKILYGHLTFLLSDEWKILGKWIK